MSAQGGDETLIAFKYWDPILKSEREKLNKRDYITIKEYKYNMTFKKMTKVVSWLMTFTVVAAFAVPVDATDFYHTPKQYQWVEQSGTLSTDGSAHEMYVNAGDTVPMSLTIKNRNVDSSALVMFGIPPTGTLLPEPEPYRGAHELRLGVKDDEVLSWVDSSSFIENLDGENNRFAVYDGVDANVGEDLTFSWDLVISDDAIDGTYNLYTGIVCEFMAWARQVNASGAIISNDIYWSVVIGEGTVVDDDDVSGDINVASIAQPTSITIPSHGVATPLVKIKLTATANPVTVTGLTIARTGLGGYAQMSRLFIEVDGVRHGSYRSLPSTNEATLIFIGADTVTIPANSSEIFTVLGNWADVTAAGDHTFSITGVNSDATSVGGLPVVGNVMTTTATEAPLSNVNDYSITSTAAIGDTQVVAAKFKLENDSASEDMEFSAITFKAIAPTSGTKVDSGDVSNFTLYYNGIAVSDATNMTDTSYIHIVLDSPITIEKGGTKYKTFELKADINDGPGRKIKIDLVDYASLEVGGTNGAGTEPLTSDVDTIGLVNGFRTVMDAHQYAPQEVVIDASDLVVSEASDNPAATTLLDGQTVTLLKGELNATKGSVTATAMTVTLTGSDMDFGTTDEYANLRVYVDGTLVSEATGSEISSSDDETSIDVAFTDTFGVDGKVPFEVAIDAATVGTGETIYATVAGTNITATRDSDNGAITESGTATGNTMTFTDGALTVALAATPVSLSKVAGSDGVEFVGITLAGGVASDSKVTAMTFEGVGVADVLASADVDNLFIHNAVGTVLAGPVSLNSDQAAVFTGLDITIGAGNTEKFILVGDLNSSLTATLTSVSFQMTDADGLTNIIAEDADGDQITVNTTAYNINSSPTVVISIVSAGRLTVELASNAPKTHQVVAATSADHGTTINLEATYEDINVKKVTLSLSDSDGDGVIDTDRDEAINKVTMYADGVEVASSYAVASGVVTFNLSSANYIRVTAGNVVELTVKTDYNSTVNGVADSGEVIRWTIDNFAADIEAIGVGSNTAIYAYPKAYDGTGIAWVDDAGHTASNMNNSGALAAVDTSFVITSASNIAVGDILLFDEDTSGAATYTSGDDFAVVTGISGTTITIIRGIGGVTAVEINDSTPVYVTDALVGGNASILYANLPSVSIDGVPQPSGTLVVGEFEALKFRLSDQTNGEEDVKLEELLINVQGQGILTSGQAGWYITSASLYNGNQLVQTNGDDVEASGSDISFSALTSDADSVLVNPSAVWTVKVTVAIGSGGSIQTNDSLHLVIDDLGSASNIGGISGGDLDWEDMEASGNQIQWIDTELTSIQGGLFTI